MMETKSFSVAQKAEDDVCLVGEDVLRVGENAAAKKRILVVDDEPSATRLVKLLLERKGDFEVQVENDSRAAVAAVKAFRPDLVLLDIIMPHLDGGSVAGQMRQIQELRDVPVVFMSACAEPIAGYPFVEKPASIDKLIEVIGQNIP